MRLCRARLCRGTDEGSAVVEFVLVAIVLLPLFMALMQLGFVLYVHNTLVASTAEGARYAANADRDPAAGAAVTRNIVKESLNDKFADNVSAGREVVDGVQTVYVEADAGMPLIGWFVAMPAEFHIRGHAVVELP